MARIFAALLLLILAATARATTFSTDVSDLWSSPTEQGWGLNAIQQGDILFLTFFVYDQNRAPIWYVGSETRFTGQTGTTLNFSGPLFQTSGPWLGGPFNPSSVGYQQVGTVTFQLTSITTATLIYSVNGVNVTKTLNRHTWRINSLAGNYIGASAGTYSNCPGASGYQEEPGTATVTQSPGSLTLRFVGSTTTCTYSGPYTQAGRMGTFSGSFSCTNGFAGSFLATEIEASITAFTARAAVQGGGCSWVGIIGGLRRQ